MVAVLFFLLPRAVTAEEGITLEAAERSAQVTATITGRSNAFAEPMLTLTLKNRTDTTLSVVVRAGLELVCSNQGYANLIVGKESRVELPPGEKTVELYALSLDPDRSFPRVDPTIRYYTRGMRDDPSLKVVLDCIASRGVQQDLSAQFAVWIESTGKTLEELAAKFGVPLANYQAETQSLRQGTCATAVPPSATTVGGGVTLEPTPPGGATE